MRRNSNVTTLKVKRVKGRGRRKAVNQPASPQDSTGRKSAEQGADVQLIIFDCDGTLIDSQNAIVEAMDHAFAKLGATPPSRQQVMAVVGLSLPEAFAELAPGFDTRIQQELADYYRNAFVELRHDPAHHEPLYAGIKDLVEALAQRQDVTMAIATGKSRRGVDRLLAREGWQDFFASIQTADGHPSKPHPSMILQALVETAAVPEATVMVGDTTYDIMMARSANVGALGVNWGYHDQHALERAGAHDVVGHPADIQRSISVILETLRCPG